MAYGQNQQGHDARPRKLAARGAPEEIGQGLDVIWQIVSGIR